MRINRKKFFEIVGITAIAGFLVSQKPIKIFGSLFNKKNRIVLKSNPLSVKRINKV
ncbi:MAG: hypothetical protein WHS65_00115 [Melioribacteraceae bacterium]